MSISILPTKLFIPQPAAKTVLRARLFRQFESGLNGVLTLVSAPAGYGKSTLLSEWVHQTSIPAAWLSLDAKDNDPVRFWAHFAAALQTIPKLRELAVWHDLLEMLTPSAPENLDQFLENLVSEAAPVTDPFVLVVDDFHLIGEHQIADGLFFMLESLSASPSGFHLVVSSRRDPPWPLARLRVRDQMAEIRAKDLRFSADETREFFSKAIQLQLSPDALSALDQRTEGWIAGLQLAAISMKGREDIVGFIRSFTGSHRFVMDFLLEEVLGQQDLAIQDFLLKTSILERLSAGLCTAVLNEGEPGPIQSAGAQHILEYLEQSNLFVVAMDDQRGWYRYHQLFAELLQKELQNQHPALVSELHRRASMWYAQAGYLAEPVEHAIATGDLDFAALQIEARSLAVIQRGDNFLIKQWLKALPDDLIRQRPILCIAQAWTSARFATAETAEELLAQAEAALTDPSGDGGMTPEVQNLVSSQIALLQVVIARARGDSTQAQQALVQDALDRIGPAGDIGTQATLLFRLGLCHLDLGSHAQADRIFSKAVELGRASGNEYAIHAASYGRMIIARLQGRLHDIAAIYHQNVEAVEKAGQPLPLQIGIDLTMMGSVHYEWHDLDQAGKCLAHGLGLVEKLGIAELVIKCKFAFACTQYAQGDLREIPQLEKIAESSGPDLKQYAAALQARLQLLLSQQGAGHSDGHPALQWAEGQQLAMLRPSAYDWEIQEKLVYARVLCWQYRQHPGLAEKSKLDAFLDFIMQQRLKLVESGWTGILIEVDVVCAVICHLLERDAEALEALQRALTAGEAQGFVRTFVDDGEPMRALLLQAAASGINKDYAQVLLAAFGETTQGLAQDKPAPPPGIFEPLSERELEVLRKLNSWLSVPEIASALHLAPTTVRTHVQNIYRKLDVHGRLEAVEKAKAYDLL